MMPIKKIILSLQPKKTKSYSFNESKKMKKLALAVIFVFAMSFGAFAQSGTGIFGLGAQETTGDQTTGPEIVMPSHGQTADQSAPLGGGALLLVGFGAAYAIARRRKE